MKAEIERRPRLVDAFPGLKIQEMARQDFGEHTDRVYHVECRRCFRSQAANWSRHSGVVVGGRGVRKWATEHRHELSLEQAAAEWMSLAHKNKCAKGKLASYFRLVGWEQPRKSVPVAKLAAYHTGSDDPSVQLQAFVAALEQLNQVAAATALG